jgi:methionine-rich copper-binding protein CopC
MLLITRATASQEDHAMRYRLTILCATATLAIGASTGHASDNDTRLEVSPRVSAAPATLNVRAFVAPEAGNRAIQIVADSGSFYRSSLIQLEGADAASVTETTIKNLPGGEYTVVLVLHGADGKRTIDRRRVVVTPTGF